MNYLTQALREHQELAVFLTLAIGFFIGRLKIGTFSLGTAVGMPASGSRDRANEHPGSRRGKVCLL